MRIVYLGSGEFGLPTLRALAASHEVVGVVTQPDRPAGRGRELTPTPIGAWAAEHLGGVPLLKPEKVNEASVLERVRAMEADAWVVIAFGQKLGRALLDGRFAINLHASLLPRWRGAAPINAAVLAGDAVTGNTVITLADRMDAGEILGQTTRAIEASVTAGELHDQLSGDGPALVGRVLDEHRRGVLVGRKQDESLATKAPKLSKADGWVEFSEGAEACRRRVHGLTPWPGVTAWVHGAGAKAVEVKLTRVACVAATEAHGGVPPGIVVDVQRGLIACGKSTLLEVVSIKPAGKREMGWSEFARGMRLGAGCRVVSGQGQTGLDGGTAGG